VFSQEIQVGTIPKFYTFTVTLPENATYVWVALSLPADMEGDAGTIYYDGVVLIKGEKLDLDAPHFEDATGASGLWGGQLFTNLLKNPSAEEGGPGLQSWANKIGAKILPAWPASLPSDWLVSFLDWKGSGWYYRATVTNMLRTFWARFGWGNVPLLGSKPYLALAFVTLLGMVGSVWAVWKRRYVFPWEVILFLGLAMVGIWIPAFFRGIGSLFGWTFIPVARYAYPAILPTVLVLNVGWLEILHILGRLLRINLKVQYVIYLLFFVILDVLAILSIIRFFYA
jgi:hypothetical protein